MNHTVTN